MILEILNMGSVATNGSSPNVGVVMKLQTNAILLNFIFGKNAGTTVL
jgi:hypothetical protein